MQILLSIVLLIHLSIIFIVMLFHSKLFSSNFISNLFKYLYLYKKSVWLLIYIQLMFCLEIAIHNFIEIQKNDSPEHQTLSVIYGIIETQISIDQGHGGKRLFLEMNNQQVKQLMKLYACGLFLKNTNGHYFSLLSLQNYQINDLASSISVKFYNDQRKIIYQAKLSISIKEHIVRLPIKPLNHTDSINHQLVNINPHKKTIHHNQTITSFLYGHQNNNNPSLKKPKNTIKQNPNKKQHHLHIQNQLYQQFQHEDVYIPPPIELVNEENDSQDAQNQQTTLNFYNNNNLIPNDSSIKKINEYPNKNDNNKNGIDYNKVLRQDTLKSTIKNNNNNNNNKSCNNNNDKSYNSNNDKNGIKQNLKRRINREQIRQIAEENMKQERKKNENKVMIPIIKQNGYELVEIGKLTKQQIIEYVNNARQKVKPKEEKKHKNQIKIPQTKIRRQLEVDKQKNEKKEYQNNYIEENESEQYTEENYDDDFESISGGNSLIKSRSRSNRKSIQVDQSIIDASYSQDFESFSQSNFAKKQHKANTISEISESLRSFSQSFKKS